MFPNALISNLSKNLSNIPFYVKTKFLESAQKKKKPPNWGLSGGELGI